MKHLFREHNEEADHLANLEAEGRFRITIGRGKKTRRSGKPYGAIGTETADVGF